MAAAAALALALPAAASATTYTVDPAGSGCASTGTSCRTVSEAAGRVEDGDRVEIRPGIYSEPPVTFEADDLTVAGSGAHQTVVGGGGAGPTLTFAGEGGRLAFVSVVHDGTRGAEDAVRATGSLAVGDAVLLAARGAAITFSGGDAQRGNRLLRVAAGSLGEDTAAVGFESESGTPAKRLLVENSILTPGARGPGLVARTLGDTPFSTAGDLTVEARHVTIAGGQGIFLDSSGANGNPGAPPLVPPAPAGDITATVTDSIVHGASTVTREAGGPTAAPNQARLTVERSDVGTLTGDGTIETSGTRSSPDQALFVDAAGRDFHLRADAPAVDAGAATAADGEVDLDAQPRVFGAASDQGADEFHNRPPTAALTASDRDVPQGRSVLFDASESRDPEADVGGGLASYRWDMGDGTVVTTRGARTDHAYRRPGRYQASVRVTDRQGGVSEPAEQVTITVRTGGVPTVRIRSPRHGTGLSFARPIVLSGTARETTGIGSVRLALRLVQRGAVRRAQAGCRWFDGRRAFRVAPCHRPVRFAAARRGTTWRRRVPARRLPRGTYELSAQAATPSGVRNTVFAPALRTLVRFHVR